MATIDLQTTPEMEDAPDALMRGRGLRSRVEAIEVAVREAAQPYQSTAHRNARSLIGLIERLPGQDPTTRSSCELSAEIDREMEAKLARLVGR
ncbi:MAG: hypothetical protein AB7P02_15595 [Alphaproteobacteria bacterium]